MGIYCLNFELFGKFRLSDGNFLFSSILEFFSELVVASFDEVFIDIFSFEEFFRSNRLLSKSGFFKDENCQNCQGYFHFFYAKHLKFHINRYSAVFSERYWRTTKPPKLSPIEIGNIAENRSHHLNGTTN